MEEPNIRLEFARVARGSAGALGRIDTMLKIDRKTGLISTAEGSVVFDPKLGPKMMEWPRPMSVTKVFEGCAKDETKVLIFLKEVPGDLILQFAADHPRFGTNWSDWDVQKETARMEWLKEFLATAGVPVGTYSWGKVTADAGGKDGIAHAFIRYTA